MYCVRSHEPVQVMKLALLQYFKMSALINRHQGFFSCCLQMEEVSEANEVLGDGFGGIVGEEKVLEVSMKFD